MLHPQKLTAGSPERRSPLFGKRGKNIPLLTNGPLRKLLELLDTQV